MERKRRGPFERNTAFKIFHNDPKDEKRKKKKKLQLKKLTQPEKSVRLLEGQFNALTGINPTTPLEKQGQVRERGKQCNSLSYLLIRKWMDPKAPKVWQYSPTPSDVASASKVNKVSKGKDDSDDECV